MAETKKSKNKNSKFLKNFLTTASTIAMISTVGAQSAAAADHNVAAASDPVAAIQNGNNMAQGNGGALDGAAFANDDTFILNAPHSFTLAGNVTIGAFAGNHMVTLNTNGNDATVAAAISAGITHTGNGNLTLSKGVTGGGLTGGDGAITVTAGGITGNVTGGAGDITVTAGDVTGDVTGGAGAITIGNGHASTVTRDVTVAAGNIIITNNIGRNATVNGAGNLTVHANNSAGNDGTIAGTLTFGAAGTGTVKAKTVTGTTTFTGNGKLELVNGGALTGAVSGLGAGEIKFLGATTVTGAMNAAALKLDLSEANSHVTFADNATAAELKFSNAVAKATLTGSKAYNFTNIKGSGANTGLIEISDATGGSLTGAFGAAGANDIRKITSNLANAANTFTFQSAVIVGDQGIVQAGAGKLVFEDDVTVDDNVGITLGNAASEVQFSADKTITATIVSTGAANNGVLNIKSANTGGGSIAKSVGNANQINTITSDIATGKAFTFDNVVKTQNLYQNGLGTLEFKGDLTATNVAFKKTGTDTGTIKLIAGAGDFTLTNAKLGGYKLTVDGNTGAITGFEVEDLYGNIEFNNTNGDGKSLNVVNGAKIGVSDIQRANKFIVSGDKSSTIALPVFAKEIELGVTAAKTITFNKTSNVGEEGGLKFTSHANVQTLAITTEDTTLGDIDFAGAKDHVVKVTGKNLTANIKNSGNANGKLELLGAGATLTGDFGDSAKSLTEISVNEVQAITGDVFVATLKNAADATLTLGYGKTIKIDTKLDVANNLTLKSSDESKALSVRGTTNDRVGTVEITNDKILTLGKNVELYGKVLKGAGANQGNIAFADAGTIDFTDAHTNVIKGIALSNATTGTVDAPIVNTIDTGGVLKLHDDGITFRQDHTVAVLKNSVEFTNNGQINFADKTGTLKFTNTAEATVTANIAGGVFAANANKSIVELNGANVKFVSKSGNSVANYKFTNDNATTKLTFAANDDNAAASGFLNATDKTHQVVFSDDSDRTFTKAFTGKFKLTNEHANTKTFTFQDDANLTDVIVGNNKTNVTFNKANLVAKQVGESGNVVPEFTITANATVNDAIFATAVKIQGDGTILTAKGNIVSANGIAANHANAELKLNATPDANTTLDAKFDGAANNGEGKLTLTSGADYNNFNVYALKKAIGETKAVSEVNFGDFNAVNLYADVKANNVNLGELAGIILHNDITLGSADGKLTVVNGSGLYVDTNTLTVAKDLSLNGKSVVVVKVASDGTSGSVKAVNHDGTLTVAPNTEVSLEVSGKPSKDKVYTILNIDLTPADATRPNYSVVTDNAYFEYAVITDGLKISLAPVNNAANALSDDFAKSGKSVDSSTKNFIKDMFDAAAGTDAAKIADVMIALDAKQKVELVERIKEAATASTTSMTNNISAALTSRMSAQTPSAIRVSDASSYVTGVAAGDDLARYGVWTSGFFNKATQKKNVVSGYKSDTIGGTIGADSKVNDDTTIGLALTMMHSNTKFKDVKSGDNVKGDGYIVSVYGAHNITNNWFAQGNVSFGNTNIRTKSNRVASSTSYEIASGKFSSMLFSTEALAGYNYALENVNIRPMAGVRFVGTNDNGYKESGAVQSFSISKKAHNKFEVVGGVQLVTAPMNLGDAPVTPELHASVNHDLIGKSPKSDIRLGGVANALSAATAKPIKTFYNVGFGVNTNYGMMEYGLGYDMNMARKFSAHQGSLKVRVNF